MPPGARGGGRGKFFFLPKFLLFFFRSPCKNLKPYVAWKCLKSFRWWWVGGCLRVTLVFCFGPKPKFCSFDLDLDQDDQKKGALNNLVEKYSNIWCYLSNIWMFSIFVLLFDPNSTDQYIGICIHIHICCPIQYSP